MGQKVNVLSKVDGKLVNQFKDMSIQHSITTKLEFNINVAGTEFTDVEAAIIHAYRCGLSAANDDQGKKAKESKTGAVNQEELYRLLRKKGHSITHKADFLREIAKEWFPIESNGEKKIKKVHLELIEMAEYLEK